MRDNADREPQRVTIRLPDPDDPVARVTETDAAQYAIRYPYMLVRGPLFGVAEQRPGEAPRWRLCSDMDSGMPQDARDSLNSQLWFTARDKAGDREHRRRLLAAVAVLEREPVDEVRVGEVRHRIVRADEFTRTDGRRPEPPRPTDPDSDGWDRADAAPSRTRGFVIDAGAATGPAEGLLRMALRDFAYTSPRLPRQVRGDSEAAVVSHPDVVMLPPAFRVLEQQEDAWEMLGCQHSTPQQARQQLADFLTNRHGFPPPMGPPEQDAAACRRAADDFRRRRRGDELEVCGRRFVIVRVERTMRIGADGPETPRSSDVDEYGPSKIHPTMDADGTITYD
ncbi:DUF5954 family protein [Streptomyces sp. WMMC500]|uniref:DUF5954 family protein n=1 Tax=Streptomyces sp. WMMC500 TaxID=3015154 RepID=UPI00248D0AD5|nr:DUF5954 family protein [Streptomyces sp. WMMC500]WBB60813.1 DUF5954 family protein [Streptomyces sp. WMMC500]